MSATPVAAPVNCAPSRDTLGWWRNGVIFQVYVRSLQDFDGDGVGDLPGVRARQPYLRSWIPAEPAVLALTRGEEFACIVNRTPQPLCAPPGFRVLLGSDPEVGEKLPPDSAGWVLLEATP